MNHSDKRSTTSCGYVKAARRIIRLSSANDSIVIKDANAAVNADLAAAADEQMECSMCGDVGLKEELFRCIKCSHRYQHTYCSNGYPKKRSFASNICNWCGDKNTAVTDQDESKESCEGNDLPHSIDNKNLRRNRHEIVDYGSNCAAANYVAKGSASSAVNTANPGKRVVRRYKLVSDVYN